MDRTCEKSKPICPTLLPRKVGKKCSSTTIIKIRKSFVFEEESRKVSMGIEKQRVVNQRGLPGGGLGVSGPSALSHYVYSGLHITRSSHSFPPTASVEPVLGPRRTLPTACVPSGPGARQDQS